MAGRGGFEPPEVLPSPVFKTGTFDHSDISRCVSRTQFYPKKIKHSLKYLKRWCPGPDLNRHGRNDRGILSPLCLPIPPPGQVLCGGTSRTRTGEWQLCRLQPYQLGDGSIHKWSGRRDSNPRPQPWQGCALPLSYSRVILQFPVKLECNYIKKNFECKEIS